MRIAFLSTVAVATLSLSVAALGQSPQSPPSGGGGAAERSQSGSGSGGASGQSQGSQQRSGPSGGGDQQRSGQSTTGGDQQRSGQSTSGTSGASGTGAASSSSSSSATNVNISNEQRTRITQTRSTLISSGPKVTRSQLHVDRVGVGVTLPRTGVQYRTVPKQIVSIIPRFRGYRYIIVEDDIVIIDPKTYRVVYVIEG
jgi:hypothetical protein